MEAIFVPMSESIRELKANSTAMVADAQELPVAVLNRNKPVGYVVSEKVWEHISELLENVELREAAQRRLMDGKAPIEVGLDEL